MRNLIRLIKVNPNNKLKYAVTNIFGKYTAYVLSVTHGNGGLETKTISYGDMKFPDLTKLEKRNA